ncbi:phospholipase A [Vandammella animalimorsus]|uniref:phospholipase A n=1 Tax=Vandammella animalimorsus TaxID=2029117 RepID=UPI00325B75B7
MLLHRPPRPLPWALAAGLGLSLSAPAMAQQPAQAAPPAATLTVHHWQQCDQLRHSDAARLACYDQWAAQQRQPGLATAPAAPEKSAASAATATATAVTAATAHGDSTHATAQPQASGSGLRAPASADAVALQPPATVVVSANDGCRNPAFGRTARMWELDADTDCGNFRFRGYRPLTIGIAIGDAVNRQPHSPAHADTPPAHQPYQHHEAQLQLSVRTKLASHLLTRGHPTKRDSLWFGYTLNAQWQAFNGQISRPFRNTDHEPELIYIYPLLWQLPGGAQLSYAGLGLNHQSNGQSDPLSRSWNRYYAMFGMELGPRWTLQARLWQRLEEKPGQDDNPGISRRIGRAELLSTWELSQRNTLALTLRHPLRGQNGGSARLEWYRTLGEGFMGGKSNLRLRTSLFHGYGDSLIDYNLKRTTLSIGLSLLDF